MRDRGSGIGIMSCSAGLLCRRAGLAIALPRRWHSRRDTHRPPVAAGFRPATVRKRGRQPSQSRWQHAAAVGGLQRRRRRGQASAACRRQRLARQPLRRHADEPCRRSRPHRDAEGAARGRRECRITQCRRADRAPGGGENRQRRRRAGAARPRREGRCEREVWRADSADVGVGAPASEDDGAADREGRRRQCGLDQSRLSASRDGRRASQEPRQRWIDAAALCRT